MDEILKQLRQASDKVAKAKENLNYAQIRLAKTNENLKALESSLTSDYQLHVIDLEQSMTPSPSFSAIPDNPEKLREYSQAQERQQAMKRNHEVALKKYQKELTKQDKLVKDAKNQFEQQCLVKIVNGIKMLESIDEAQGLKNPSIKILRNALSQIIHASYTDQLSMFSESFKTVAQLNLQGLNSDVLNLDKSIQELNEAFLLMDNDDTCEQGTKLVASVLKQFKNDAIQLKKEFKQSQVDCLEQLKKLIEQRQKTAATLSSLVTPFFENSTKPDSKLENTLKNEKMLEDQLHELDSEIHRLERQFLNYEAGLQRVSAIEAHMGKVAEFFKDPETVTLQQDEAFQKLIGELRSIATFNNSSSAPIKNQVLNECLEAVGALSIIASADTLTVEEYSRQVNIQTLSSMAQQVAFSQVDFLPVGDTIKSALQLLEHAIEVSKGVADYVSHDELSPVKKTGLAKFKEYLSNKWEKSKTTVGVGVGVAVTVFILFPPGAAIGILLMMNQLNPVISLINDFIAEYQKDSVIAESSDAYLKDLLELKEYLVSLEKNNTKIEPNSAAKLTMLLGNVEYDEILKLGKDLELLNPDTEAQIDQTTELLKSVKVQLNKITTELGEPRRASTKDSRVPEVPESKIGPSPG